MGVWTSSKRSEQRRGTEKVKAICERGESEGIVSDSFLREMRLRENVAMYKTTLLPSNKSSYTQMFW